MILSFLALLPILVLIVLLTIFKKPAIVVAPVTLSITVILALFLWNMDSHLLGLAALEGAIYGLWPIGIIIFGSISLSNLMLETGSVKKIEGLVGSVSSDIRIMVVLVAWGLESFLEAIAGFGSGLALPISILTVMGVSPLKAGIVALLANSVPTTYGGVGIGLTALVDASSQPLDLIAKYVSWQLFIPSLMMPFIIVRVIAGSWKKTREIFWVPLCAGLGQGLGLMLPINSVAMIALLSGMMNLGGGIGAVYFFYPNLRSNQKINWKEAWNTLLPFTIAISLILITGPLVPFINSLLSNVVTKITIFPEGKPLVFRWFMDAGVFLLLAGVIGAYFQGLKVPQIIQNLKKTSLQLKNTLIILVSILAMAKIMTYSGMIDSLSQGIAYSVGEFYPLISPILGAIGTLVTGSVASSGILMGALQAEMGVLLNISPSWLVALNASGASGAKMLAPHSVAIVLAALGSSEEEGNIIRFISKMLMLYLFILMIVSWVGVKFM